MRGVFASALVNALWMFLRLLCECFSPLPPNLLSCSAWPYGYMLYYIHIRPCNHDRRLGGRGKRGGTELYWKHSLKHSQKHAQKHSQLHAQKHSQSIHKIINNALTKALKQAFIKAFTNTFTDHSQKHSPKHSQKHTN